MNISYIQKTITTAILASTLAVSQSHTKAMQEHTCQRIHNVTNSSVPSATHFIQKGFHAGCEGYTVQGENDKETLFSIFHQLLKINYIDAITISQLNTLLLQQGIAKGIITPHIQKGDTIEITQGDNNSFYLTINQTTYLFHLTNNTVQKVK